MKNIFLLLFLAVGVFFCAPVSASETISDFDVTLNINADSSLNITEKITYDFGTEARHGIYRDIPYKYKARGGNFNLRITDISVENTAGDPFVYTVQNKEDNKNIKIGSPNSYVTGSITYVIKYTIGRAINYFTDYDELYWNATGDEWEVPIKQSRATVIFPSGSDEDDTKAECFAGAPGSAGKCVSYRYKYSAENIVSGIVFTDDYLNPGHGLTVVAGFSKGIVEKPSYFKGVVDIIKDNWILGLPIIVFIAMFYLWNSRGRDPRARGTIIAQFDPPDKLTPAEVGTIIDETAHNKDISAEIINLAIRGYLKINKINKKGILSKEDYKFIKLKDGSDLVNRFESKLFSAIFSGSAKETKLSDLKNKFYKDLNEIIKEVYYSVVSKEYFLHSPRKVRVGYMSGGLISAIALAFLLGSVYSAMGVISAILSGIIIFIFSFFMPAKTKKGALALEHILGLKKYMEVAEKDRINFHSAPEKNPEQFEKLLPFAMVLGVEKAWAGQFKDIYKNEPDWYHDSGVSRGEFSSMYLASSLVGFQANANTILASQPGSASSGGSGFSGGGFSGGGFGGGGGGSW